MMQTTPQITVLLHERATHATRAISAQTDRPIR